jgi:hypothetical protein
LGAFAAEVLALDRRESGEEVAERGVAFVAPVELLVVMWRDETWSFWAAAIIAWASGSRAAALPPVSNLGPVAGVNGTVIWSFG